MSLFDSASICITPNGVKEGKLYSIKPTDGSGDLSVTRATTATRVNSDGLIEVTPYNLLQRSQEFENAYWAKANTTVTSNATTAPNGTLTADLILNTVAGGYINNTSFVGLIGIVYSYSFYIKNNNSTSTLILVRASSTALSATINWSGSNISSITNTTGTSTFTALDNGWFRISGTYTSTEDGQQLRIYPQSGSGTNSVYVWGAQLVTGTSAKDYYPTTTRLNIPRLDYTNGSCPSILVEPQRTNIFAKSQTTSTWTFTNISRTANNGISPDGTQNADLLFPTTSGAVSFNSDNTASSLVVGQPFVCSFFIKLNTSFTSNVGTNIIDLRLSGASVWTRPTIRVNFETGEVTNVANASYISSTNYGNGWYRITFGAIPTGTGSAVALQSPTGVTLDGGSFYIWGLQGESNSTYATSYIPTTSASVTRNADVISKTGISSLIGQTEGTMFCEIKAIADDNVEKHITLSDGTNNNIVDLYYGFWGAGSIFCGVKVAGTTQGGLLQGTLTVASMNKIAVVYKTNRFELWINGSKVAEDLSGNTFSGTTLSKLETATNGANPFFGNINSIQLYKTALSSDELAKLTTI